LFPSSIEAHSLGAGIDGLDGTAAISALRLRDMVAGERISWRN
jgi:hypothetical protein